MQEYTERIFESSSSCDAGDKSRFVNPLSVASFEAIANAIADEEETVQIRKIRGRGQVTLFTASYERPEMLIVLVASKTQKASGSWQHLAAIDLEAILEAEYDGFRHTVLQPSRYPVQTIDGYNVLSSEGYIHYYTWNFSYSVPKNVKKLFRSDEHLVEENLQSQIIFLFRQENMGVNDIYSLEGDLYISYNQSKESIGLAER